MERGTPAKRWATEVLARSWGYNCAKPMIFAYFGPETSLPLTSAATAVVGFALMMGRVSFAFITRRIRFARRK